MNEEPNGKAPSVRYAHWQTRPVSGNFLSAGYYV